MNPNDPGGGGYGGFPGGPPGGGGYGGPPGGGGYWGPPGGGYGPPGGGGYPPPGGGFGGPPAYGAFGVPGAPIPGAAPPDLGTKLAIWSILSFLSIFCGCGLFGVVPIIFAILAMVANSSGNYAEAESRIRIAKIFVCIGYVLFAVVIALNVVMALVK